MLDLRTRVEFMAIRRERARLAQAILARADFADLCMEQPERARSRDAGDGSQRGATAGSVVLELDEDQMYGRRSDVLAPVLLDGLSIHHIAGVDGEVGRLVVRCMQAQRADRYHVDDIGR